MDVWMCMCLHRVGELAIQRLACSRHRALQTPDRGRQTWAAYEAGPPGVVCVGGPWGEQMSLAAGARCTRTTPPANHCFASTACSSIVRTQFR